MTDADPRPRRGRRRRRILPRRAARGGPSPAARRALEEARARRETVRAPDLPPELGGRDGPEPVRYGDWEKKGIAYDF